jgi:hypothetical protein
VREYKCGIDVSKYRRDLHQHHRLDQQAPVVDFEREERTANIKPNEKTYVSGV